MQDKEIQKILTRYHAGTATVEEKAIIETLYTHLPALKNLPAGQLEADQQRSIDLLVKEYGLRQKRSLWPTLAAAASLLLFLGLSSYFLWHKRQQSAGYIAAGKQQHDIPPGGNKAILTLANGSVIVLNNAKSGRLANQGNIAVSKTADGTISYSADQTVNRGAEVLYNTASTPRGGQYQFVLADGTKVWLNAQSSIKFPVNFSGKERKVELTGEAYFEVVHDAARPFRVLTKGQVVEDIGTHFDINAYGDEDFVKTTLLEGSIQVSAGGDKRVLIPGEQVQIKDGEMKVIKTDIEETIAWKNGFFHFDDSPVQEVARQLSRWYDADIKYEGAPTSRLFSGAISRNVNASQILDILSFEKIHYRIDGKTIIILP